EEIGRLLDARRHVGAHEIDRGAALEADELVVAEVDAKEIGRARVAPGGGGDVAKHRAVLGGDLAEIMRAVVAAAARVVLHDDVGMAVDVLGEVPREYSALDVARRAGIEVDQDGEPLAL